MKVEWLDRALTTCAYYYCLCTSEKQFVAELDRIKLPAWKQHQWISPDMHATTHHFVHAGKPLAMVCIAPDPTRTGIQIAALLVHEAVHIWQRHAAYIGSHNDHGDEEEAYAIQNIAQNLMESYREHTK
jgi:hypothetical protein